MPFNEELPKWKPNNPDPTPTDEKLERGFSAGERPPASIFNWFFNRTYRALKILFDNAIHKETLGKPGGPAKLGDNGKLVAGQENAVEIKDASIEQKGIVRLSDATNSNSTILAATANAVKKVYDLAFAKYSKPSSGIPKTDLDTSLQTALTKVEKVGGELIANIVVPSDTLKIDIPNVGGYKYYQVIAEFSHTDSGDKNVFLRFNDDATANYNVGSTTLITGITLNSGNFLTNTGKYLHVFTISNADINKWKMVVGMVSHPYALTAPTTYNGKWNNITDLINKISFVFGSNGNIKAGSTVQIIGYK